MRSLPSAGKGRALGCGSLVRTLCSLILTLGVLLDASGATAAPASDDSWAPRPEEGQVTRLYLAALGREPDDGGREYWVRHLIEGRALSQVAQFFVTGPEFVERFGVETADDTAFVQLVYGNVLGRSPDPQGELYWRQRLADGLGRQRLVLFFSESAEFATRTGTAPVPVEPFSVSVSPATTALLGSSWRSGCPVPVGELSLLVVRHIGFDGSSEVGSLVVHDDVVVDVVEIFRQLYEGRYPIERMDLITDFGSDDEASMAANNTSAFNCRPVAGGSAWSRHAYGRAVDLNPLQNPYRRGSVVLPVGGDRFLDRALYHPAMIRDGDLVTRAFEQAGWRWGGRWSNPIDYQHFDHP